MYVKFCITMVSLFLKEAVLFRQVLHLIFMMLNFSRHTKALLNDRKCNIGTWN